MLIWASGMDWGGVVFLGGLGLAVVVLLANWVRNIVMGQENDDPAEVPMVMTDAVAIPPAGNKKPLIFAGDDKSENLLEKGDDCLTDPAYSFLVCNIYHRDD